MGNIREVKLGDFDELEDLARKSWIKGFSDVLSDREIEIAREKDEFVSRQDLKNKIESENRITLVYVHDSKVMGQGGLAWGEESFEFVKPGETQIRSLYVRPDCWRKGVGSKLIEELLSLASEKSSNVKVEAFKNSDSVKFYKNNGFRKIGESRLKADDIDVILEDHGTLLLERNV